MMLDNFVSAEELARQAGLSSKVCELIRNKNLTAFVITLGCQQNEADSERIRGVLRSLGYTITQDETIADIIIVNTCAIREHAEKRALSIIGRYKHNKTRNPDTIIGVCGCMPAQEHRLNQLKHSYHYVDFVFGTGSLHRLPEFVYNALTKGKRMFVMDEERPKIAEGLPVIRESAHKAWVSIMYGCNNFCTYCIVPYVRGRERSRLPEDIINEIKALVDSGCKDITLLGQNVNSYGKELEGGYNISYLLREIASLEGEFWVHLMTSHPKDASDELVHALGAGENIANCFHLPLQSGSDAILKKMNRHYDIERYMSIINKLKQTHKDIVLTTDIIVGFPGETDDDFEKTLDIIKQVEYDSVYTFLFSPRRGTPAYEMENQIPEHIKKARFERLNEVQNEISRAKNEAMIGKTVKVLVDGKSKNNDQIYTSRTEGNKIVHFEADEDYTGKFINIKITRADTFALYGEI
ncbi:MAG: tRNA (N6-isopentenyl adenosine(37)-C2)-methylthiotransferase MiaB [Clostridia bacterium]|nr:tRNA (N6-isopentenyl adenosine(37)-C2)-methylthiotransferase MiaB [Clostridia bacterium]